MRGLAEYAMLGRRQAIIVVFLTGLFPLAYLISAAFVGLVHLRKGPNEGLIILLWSLLPAGIHWVRGDTTPVILMFSVFALSYLLKHENSWQKVIMLGTGIGLLCQISLNWQSSYLVQINEFVTAFIAAQDQQGAPLLYTSEQLVEILLSVYGIYHAIAVIVCLMLARWLQAVLYNPGGFQQEFHLLRFDPKLMLPLTGLIFAGLMAVTPLDSWLTVFCVPPVFGGIAFLHYTVAKKEMGSGWLILCYLGLLLMPPIIVILGILDSVFDIRKRITT